VASAWVDPRWGQCLVFGAVVKGWGFIGFKPEFSVFSFVRTTWALSPTHYRLTVYYV
jgi:hypothetical protein